MEGTKKREAESLSIKSEQIVSCGLTVTVEVRFSENLIGNCNNKEFAEAVAAAIKDMEARTDRWSDNIF